MWWNSRVAPGCVISIVSIMVVLGASIVASADDAREFVRQALRAESRGDQDLRSRLLEKALKTNCDLPEARWHSGHLRVEGQWLSIEEAQRHASEDDALTEYRRLRDTYGGTLQGQVLLARYCRKQQMKDREQLHWTYVLRADPRHSEAIRAMDLLPFKGRLMTEQQIHEYTAWVEQDRKLKQQWTKRLKAIRVGLSSGDSDRVQIAMEQLAAIRDPAAVPYLISILAGKHSEWDLQIVRALGQMTDQAATQALMQFAVLSEFPAVIDAATRELKVRPMFSYVPILMGSMATPIEFSYSMTSLSGGMMACYNLTREGPTALLSYRLTSTVESNPRRIPRQTAATSLRVARARSNRVFTALDVQRNVLQTNLQAAQLNARIDRVLSEVTGEDFSGRPQAWWRWWQDYNDLHYTNEKQVSEAHTHHVVMMVSCECFLPGTPVWTETGPVAIEKIRVGDRVLSQDVDTGELKYQFVLQTTVRPDAETKRIRVGGEDIYATNGHPLWVDGEGWRMARNLRPGMRLHTADGAVDIDEVYDGPTSRVHNMVVAGFNAYFVGGNRVLAHDNTIRQPTRTVVPGLRRRATDSSNEQLADDLRSVAADSDRSADSDQ